MRRLLRHLCHHTDNICVKPASPLLLSLSLLERHIGTPKSDVPYHFSRLGHKNRREEEGCLLRGGAYFKFILTDKPEALILRGSLFELRH